MKKLNDISKILEEVKGRIDLLDKLIKDQLQEDYILLGGRKHGNYSYPDLLVSMHRLGLTQEVEQAAGKLGFKVSNTAQEQDGHQYIGNIQLEHALNLNLLLDGFTLNPRQFFDFKELLEQGIKGKKVYNGSGKLLDSRIIESVYDEIYKVRGPRRGEFLDTYFKEINGILHINYNHRIVNGSLQPQNSEPLEDCLMEECYVDLSSVNRQGLPTRKGNDFNYWYPRNNSVAWFVADSVRSNFDCGWDHGSSDSSFGVRRAKIKG